MEDILTCKCGWYGSVTGSECRCCPDCGNGDLTWLSYLQKRVKELEDVILKYGNNPAGFDWAVLDELDKQEERIKELKDALGNYGQHKPDCSYAPCNCGFAQYK